VQTSNPAFGKQKRYGIMDLVKELGYPSLSALLLAEACEGNCPAICVRCGWTTETESDQDRGLCECCDKGGTVKSVLILAGMI